LLLDIAAALAHNARRVTGKIHYAMIQRNAASVINWRSRSAAGFDFAFRFSFSFYFSAHKEREAR
jgi:hypothetical protein